MLFISVNIVHRPPLTSPLVLSLSRSSETKPSEVSNDDLSEVMETTDEWITQRTGIRRRHVLQPEESLVCGRPRSSWQSCSGSGWNW